MTALLVRTMVILLSALIAAALPAAAAPEKAEKKEKARTVIVHKDGGEPLVLADEGEGPVRLKVKAVKRGFLGVALAEMTPELRTHFGAPDDAGVLVSRVEADSPAGRAGIRVGDIISAVDGDKTASVLDLTRAVRARKDGDTLALEVWRDRKVQTITATVVERDRETWDMGDVLMFKSDGALPREFDFKVDPEKINEMVEQMQKQFSSPEWQQKVQRYQEMEKRMQQLEKKLQEMEKKLRERSAAGSTSSRT